MVLLEIAVVGFLVLLNGFLAMSEIAVVSSRRGRLRHMAQTGARGARRALKLAEDPTGFLSTVQIGITLVGILAGAYSGATLAGPLGEALAPVPGVGAAADDLALTLVVVAITYLSLIVGELVPKRIALSNAEGIAALVAPFMTALARAAHPAVWFLGLSTDALLRLIGVKPRADSTVTEEEVKSLIAEGADAGIFHPAEKDMIDGVLRLADRSVRSIMVPRPEVVWLDPGDPADAVLDEVRDSGHSRYPVSRGDIDAVIGIVDAKGLLDQMRRTGTLDLAAAAYEPLYVSDATPVLRLLERFKEAGVHMAIVLDEHGSFEGLATPTDVLTAIAGGLPERADEQEPEAVRRDDGSWLLDGRMAVHDVERTLELAGMGTDGSFVTLAGFVLHRLGRIPEAGESFEWRGWRFEVVDLDGRRIDKVLAAPAPAPGKS